MNLKELLQHKKCLLVCCLQQTFFTQVDQNFLLIQLAVRMNIIEIVGGETLSYALQAVNKIVRLLFKNVLRGIGSSTFGPVVQSIAAWIKWWIGDDESDSLIASLQHTAMTYKTKTDV